MLKRVPMFAAVAGLAASSALAGCSATSAGQPRAAATPAPGTGTAAASRSPGAPSASAAVSPAPACPQPGAYLTAVRTGQHATFDRVVFEFSGGLPAYQANVVTAVYSDPKGDEVPLAGQARLRVVFHGASASCQQPARETYTKPAAPGPFYPRLLVVSPAGDFEHVLSFGIGLAAQGTYRAYTLTGPDRVVIDFSHVALARFPGIWDITSWPQYWARQYAWKNGQQPWLGNPAMVVAAWARSRWQTVPPVRQVTANTFAVTEPGGRVDTVTGTVPVAVPGPWVITKIS
jgi:hypothetical protein